MDNNSREKPLNPALANVPEPWAFVKFAIRCLESDELDDRAASQAIEGALIRMDIPVFSPGGSLQRKIALALHARFLAKQYQGGVHIPLEIDALCATRDFSRGDPEAEEALAHIEKKWVQRD